MILIFKLKKQAKSLADAVFIEHHTIHSLAWNWKYTQDELNTMAYPYEITVSSKVKEII